MSINSWVDHSEIMGERVTAQTERQILQAYRASHKSINTELAELYRKAGGGVLSHADASKYTGYGSWRTQ